jgi:uncharacterized phage-associated protein
MPGFSPFAIANEFIKLAGREALSSSELQKLVFVAHGWNLAYNKQPLIAGNAEAAESGPVFRELADHLARLGEGPVAKLLSPAPRMAIFGGDARPYVAALSDPEKMVIASVWKRYGRVGAFKLASLTQQVGSPWYTTFYSSGRNAVLEPEQIRQYFVTLAKDRRG